jgi:hypothetical protein
MLVYLDTVIAFAVAMLGFSLLITLFNQMVSSFLGLRGANLLWGIQSMLSTLDPKLNAHVEDIARRVLTDPVVSDSIFARTGDVKIPVIGALLKRWKLASAIGPDAMLRSLAKVANDLKTEKPDVAKAIEDMIGEVDPAATRKLDMVKRAFAQLQPPPGFAVQVDDFLKQLGNSAQQSVGRVEAWFNVSMNRVAQRFTMKIRIVTVIFAFLLSFGIHLDSFTLFNQLLGNPELRQKVLAKSTAMLDEADAVLGAQAGQLTTAATEPTTSPKVLTGKMKELIDKDINKQTEAQPQLLGALPVFNNFAEAEKWLSDGLKPDVKPERKQELLTIYRRYVIAGLKAETRDVAALLQQAGLELVPGDRSFSDLKKDPLGFFFSFNGTKNFLGILLTAGLLALGAPFWYNALKTLTSLQPMVTTRNEKQRHEAAES